MQDFLKGGGGQIIKSPRKGGGGSRGSSFGPFNVKSLHRGLNGGADPRRPPPPRSATVLSYLMENLIGSLESSRV